MSTFDLNKLMSDRDLKAFAALWPRELENAKSEMRWVLDLVAKPSAQKSKYEDLLSKLVIALVGSDPDLSAWIQAIAGEGFELRPEQRYAIPGQKDRPSRFVDRGLNDYDNGTSALQQKLGITDGGVRDGINLVAISAVLKEFRNHVTGRRALGPAWPVFVSVDEYLGNPEHRQLYQFGDDVVLQKRIAATIKATLKEYMAEREASGESIAVEERAADWQRKLPPGADPVGYFGRGSVAAERYRDALANELEITLSETGDAAADAEAIRQGILQTTSPTEVFPYWHLRDGTRRISIEYTDADCKRLRAMLPMLTRTDADEQMKAFAVRAALRRYWPDAVGTAYSETFLREVRSWVERGYGPPPDLRIEHVHLFEDQACYHYFENGDLSEWRKLGMFPKDPPVPSDEYLDWINENWRELWDLQHIDGLQLPF